MKFYDFNKSKIECPSCQTEFNPDQLLKSRRGRTAKATPAATETDEITEDAIVDDEEDEETDALGGDEALVNIPS